MGNGREKYIINKFKFKDNGTFGLLSSQITWVYLRCSHYFTVTSFSFFRALLERRMMGGEFLDTVIEWDKKMFKIIVPLLMEELQLLVLKLAAHVILVMIQHLVDVVLGLNLRKMKSASTGLVNRLPGQGVHKITLHSHWGEYM